MKGQREVVAAGLAAARDGRPGVLVTVVRVEGSAYRRPGARMFLPGDGPPVGLVSGGCLEVDLAERAAVVLASNAPRTVLYDMRSPDDVVWGLGLGCNGTVRVLLEPIGASRPPADLEFLDACCDSRRAGVIVTVFAVSGEPGVAVCDRMLVDLDGSILQSLSGDAVTEPLQRAAQQALTECRSRVVQAECAAGNVEALIEYVQPPIRLIVFGAGLDAVPVVEQAAALGWSVVVLDHRPAHAVRAQFPLAASVRLVEWSRLTAADVPLDSRTATVLMTHHFLNDLEILSSLVPRAPAYVGLLGPRQRAENLVVELTDRGIVVGDDMRRRMHGPVGLDIGSETPGEIALSLLAEIQAVFAGRCGGALRERTQPLHDWES